MPTPETRRPTDAELAILQALWELGPSTVRQIHAHLNSLRRTGYTTVLKHMQIMTDKGLLERDEAVRPQVFRPAREQQWTQNQLLSDLVERAYRGNHGKLVLQALSSRRTTSEERNAIRELLDRLEGESS